MYLRLISLKENSDSTYTILESSLYEKMIEAKKSIDRNFNLKIRELDRKSNRYSVSYDYLNGILVNDITSAATYSYRIIPLTAEFMPNKAVYLRYDRLIYNSDRILPKESFKAYESEYEAINDLMDTCNRFVRENEIVKNETSSDGNEITIHSKDKISYMKILKILIP